MGEILEAQQIMAQRRFSLWEKLRRFAVRHRAKGWQAASTRDLDSLLLQLEQTEDPLDRHFIYENIVRETFRRRKDDHRMRDLCEQIGLRHLEEFPKIAPLLREEIGYGRMPHVATFQCLATLMTEWGAYKKAIDIYEMGLAYGIDDKDTGGFQARIAALYRLMR